MSFYAENFDQLHSRWDEFGSQYLEFDIACLLLLLEKAKRRNQLFLTLFETDNMDGFTVTTRIYIDLIVTLMI